MMEYQANGHQICKSSGGSIQCIGTSNTVKSARNLALEMNKAIAELRSTYLAQIAALTDRAERAEKLYEAAKPLADMMSLAAFRSNPRMSDGYCSPMGGVKEYELRHQSSAIREAVEKYDIARREAGRDATDSAVARVEGER